MIAFVVDEVAQLVSKDNKGRPFLGAPRLGAMLAVLNPDDIIRSPSAPRLKLCTCFVLTAASDDGFLPFNDPIDSPASPPSLSVVS